MDVCMEFSILFQVYCDMVSVDQTWTLLTRFSNSDTKNWMDDSGDWWYDYNEVARKTADPSYNADMISPAFWLVSGSELKITRNDDSGHTPLLQTTGNCLSGKTFRSKIETENVTFGFSFRISVSFPFYESLNVTVWKWYRFFCVLAAKSEKLPTNDHGLRMAKTLPFIHQPDRLARKASDELIGDIKCAWKNIVFFHVRHYGFPQGWQSLYNTVVYMIKTVSRKLANITTVSRKSLHPIKTFIYGYSGCIKILPYDSLLKNLYLLHELLKCLLIALHSVT